jgi:DNA-binding LytR/AlgR family response regulator
MLPTELAERGVRPGDLAVTHRPLTDAAQRGPRWSVHNREKPAPVLRCLVVDNQPATMDQLARMLRANPAVARVSTAADSAGALRVLRDVDVDVAFIEVRMPGLDGMELAGLLKRFRTAPEVVFVTRHSGRAAEAFDVGAVDYLSKPPRPDRLAESLRRVRAIRHALGRHAGGAAVPAPPAPRAALDGDDETIPVERAGATKLVARSTVRWVRARGDYAVLHTADGSHLIRARFAALADCWRDAGLVRIHRSYLVQLRFVTGVRVADSGQLTVIVDGHELPVSRRLAPTVRDQLLGAAHSATGG